MNEFALLKATAKEYVRASQTHLILQPLTARLSARLGQAELVERLNRIIAALRAQARLAPGYAAGNVLNLLLHLGVDVRGTDLSRLNVQQAYLQGALLPEVNFSQANLAHSVFTRAFGKILAIHFEGNGQLLVTGLSDDKLCMRQAVDGQTIYELNNFASSAVIMHFSPDGRVMASGDADHRVRLWDVTHGRLLHTLEGHTDTPWGLAFSSDGQMLASSGLDGTIHLWDLRQTGSLRQTFRGHVSTVTALAFTNDGRTLASGDVDGRVCMWRVGVAEPMHTLLGHTDEVHALAFDGTGTILASGSHDETIKLWDLRSVALARRDDACLMTLRADGPYAGMNITGVTGVNPSQKAALKALGAVEET